MEGQLVLILFPLKRSGLISGHLLKPVTSMFKILTLKARAHAHTHTLFSNRGS